MIVDLIEAFYRLLWGDLFTLPVIQTEILDNAASYVRPGGVLVYSTCTILPEENEQVSALPCAQGCCRCACSGI